jgi:anti-sigma factor RsiW
VSDFTERELVDFLDKKLSDLRETELAAALAQDPHLEMRLMALDSVATVVRDAFTDLGAKWDLDKVLPVLNTASRKSPVWRPWLMTRGCPSPCAS